LAVIDPVTRSKVGDIPLKAHPESFQIDPDTSQIFVNVPEAHAVAVVDCVARMQTASWPMARQGGNFPMALDHARRRVFVVFRSPAELGIFSMTDGKLITTQETCGDADDVFIDAKRDRVYVSCGAGFLDVFEMNAGVPRHTARIPTVAGARTSLFVPEFDRLFVAARASSGAAADIWVFRPTP
jgi:hypothetical protein